MAEHLKALQEKEKEILNFIVEFCNQNHIPYFLTDGTLLGAVRHQGFIPWDDDMDIGMIRKDYNRFLQLFSTYIKETKYELEANEVDHHCILNFAKVHDTSTTLIQEMVSDAQNKQHVFVDIFPFDQEPDNKLKAYYQWIKTRLISFTLNVRTKIARTSADRFPLRFVYFLLEQHYKKYTNQQLFNLRKKLTTKYNGTKTLYYSNIVLSKPKTCLIETKTIEKRSQVRFDGRNYQAPFDPNLYLSSYYGNYMALPPEEKRVNVHHLIYLQLGDQVFDKHYFEKEKENIK